MFTPAVFSPQTLAAQLAEVLAPRPVALAYLFGSAAAGQATPFSDVDIALVLLAGQAPLKDRLNFELTVEDEIVRRCHLSNADVRVINDAPLVLRGQVVTEGILLFARDEDQRIEFETRTRMEYFDFLPTAEAYRQAFFAAVREGGLHGQRQKSARPARQPEHLRRPLA